MNDLHEATMAASLRQARAGERVMTERAIRAERRNAVLESRESHFKVTEGLTYEANSEHSFFLDAYRGTRLLDPAARERLARHQREMDVELPRRRDARAKAATAAYERAFGSTWAEQDALERMQAAGIQPFERRAMSRTPGQGGYFDPPLYLIQDYVQFAREASPFADLWRKMPLPEATSEINVPRITTGTATGPQTADLGMVVGRDITDSLVSQPVRTVAGILDASRQWFEQGQGSGGYGADRMIWADLTADLAQNVDGQCLLGNDGSNGQLLGVWPGGTVAAANGILVADSNNATGQSWTTASSGASLHVNAAQLASLVRRLRGRNGPLAWIWHPWVWSLYTASVDSQNRPLVLGQNIGALPDGAVGEYQNIPVYTDANIPTTFGGAGGAPSIGAITNGQYAALPGTGAGNSYTPLLLARPQDLYLFQGDIKMQVLQEPLAGSMQVRFRLHCYLVAMPNRFVAAAATGSNVSAGGNTGYGTLTWQQSNSLLILSGSGY